MTKRSILDDMPDEMAERFMRLAFEAGARAKEREILALIVWWNLYFDHVVKRSD